MNIFRPKMVFSGPARYIRILFFLKTGVFPMRHFLICFHRSPPQFSLEMKRFVIMKDSLGFLALCDLPKTYLPIKFFSIFERFSVEQMEYYEWIRVLSVSLWVFFGAVKLVKS